MSEDEIFSLFEISRLDEISDGDGCNFKPRLAVTHLLCHAHAFFFILCPKKVLCSNMQLSTGLCPAWQARPHLTEVHPGVQGDGGHGGGVVVGHLHGAVPLAGVPVQQQPDG